MALLLFGSVVVLGVGELNYDDNTAETYCLYSPYMFAYVMIILSKFFFVCSVIIYFDFDLNFDSMFCFAAWIGLALAGICFCCALATGQID